MMEWGGAGPGVIHRRWPRSAGQRGDAGGRERRTARGGGGLRGRGRETGITLERTTAIFSLTMKQF